GCAPCCARARPRGPPPRAELRFGHETQAEPAPTPRRHASRIEPADAHRKFLGERRLARKRIQQLLLAITGNSSGAHDLARAHFEAKILEVGAERIVGRMRETCEL